MPALVTLQAAKDHLSIVDEDHNSLVQKKIDDASAIVLDYCNSTAYWRAITATWTQVTVPGHVRAAVLLWITHLYENRGDDMKADDALWAATKRLLDRTHDPVLA